MKSFLVVIFCFSVFQSGTAQEPARTDSLAPAFPDSLFTVDSIKVWGNDETKDFVIIREMTLQRDSLITHEAIEYDQNRIYSLGLFNRVEMEIEPTSGTSANLHVRVHERWYIYPFPIFGLKDRDWSKVYYGVGLMHINFRGRNEKIFASFALGFDPWVSLSYKNSFLEPTGTYFLESGISYNRVRNRSTLLEQQVGEFDEEHYSISLTAGKRVGIQHVLWANVGYRSVTTQEAGSPGIPAIVRTDNYPRASVGYMYDTRDLSEYPSYGRFASISMTKFNIPSGDIDFIHLNADYRHYIPVTPSFVMTGRVFTVLTAGKEPPSYEHVYFGYGERIRGHFKQIMEGENLAGISTELHYSLLAPVYVTVGFLPKEFSLWRFGITAAVFADAGTVWFRDQRVDWLNSPSGYGGGLHFLLPFGIVFRTEYAWNELGKSEFIFDVGASY